MTSLIFNPLVGNNNDYTIGHQSLTAGCESAVRDDRDDGQTHEPRSPAPRARGQGLVEFALVFPVFILLLFGIFDLGRAVYAYNTIGDAAREGARVAIVNQIQTSPDCVQDRPIQDLANPHWSIKACAIRWANALDLTASDVTVSYAAPPGITLTCSPTVVRRLHRDRQGRLRPGTRSRRSSAALSETSRCPRPPRSPSNGSSHEPQPHQPISWSTTRGSHEQGTRNPTGPDHRHDGGRHGRGDPRGRTDRRRRQRLGAAADRPERQRCHGAGRCDRHGPAVCRCPGTRRRLGCRGQRQDPGQRSRQQRRQRRRLLHGHLRDPAEGRRHGGTAWGRDRGSRVGRAGRLGGAAGWDGDDTGLSDARPSARWRA